MDIYWTRSNAPASDSLDNCIGISSHQKASVRFDAWAGGSTRARLACALGIPSIQCQTRREHQGSGKSCAKGGSVTASASRSLERSYQLNERQCLGALHPLEIARHLNLRRVLRSAYGYTIKSARCQDRARRMRDRTQDARSVWMRCGAINRRRLTQCSLATFCTTSSRTLWSSTVIVRKRPAMAIASSASFRFRNSAGESL
jgi:hypothetical protein